MAEAISVIGLIGAIVNIIEAIKETYTVAKEVNRLPKAFAVVNERIPLVQRTLFIVETHYKGSTEGPAIRDTFVTCKEKAEDLQFIFERVCPVEGEGILQRYQRALRSLKPGRSDKVENLFKDILDTLQTLQAFHIFKNLIPTDDLAAAMQDVEDCDPSIVDTADRAIYSYGNGAMFHHGPGEFKVKQQNGDGNYQAETMNFGAPAVQEHKALNPTRSKPFIDPELLHKRVDTDLYTRRPTASKKLEDMMAQRLNRRSLRKGVVVHGIGGTGKTQLVLRYVEDHIHEYSTVIWIDATSKESFVWSCFRICSRLRLLQQGAQNDIYEALAPQRSPVVDDLLIWLEARDSQGNWLVVLDNVDDMSWGIKDVVPRGSSGIVLATSRDSHTSQPLGYAKLSLESMELNEATSFLRNASFPFLDDQSDDLDKSCKEASSLVDCHPLAVHLAAAMIQRSPKISTLDEVTVEDACEAVSDYIERFGQDKDLVLRERAYSRFMQSPYPMTVFTTFETTFVKLKSEKRPRWEPPPITILAMIACLDDERVVDLHTRFEQAYVGIRSGHSHAAYGTVRLRRWLCKILTGESSIRESDMEDKTWDNRGYCQTLGALHRFGLVGSTTGGLPHISSLHKLVRWRVEASERDKLRECLEQYTVLLELALASKAQNETHTLRTLNELADLYMRLENWQYAETCARLHLQKQIAISGRQHANTICSLERVIEILVFLKLPHEIQQEIFLFVKDAPDRGAVLKAFPAGLLKFLNSVFMRQREAKWTTNWTRASSGQLMPPEQSDGGDQNPIAMPINSLVPTIRPELPSARYESNLTIWQPELQAQGLSLQVSEQLEDRKRFLHSQASKTPDLVTLFEVFTMGSSDLLSDYMQHINEDTVHYRDPVGSRTVLHFMAAYGQPGDIAKCISKGSDVAARDRYGATPLHIAAMQGRPEVYLALEEAPGSNGALKDQHGRTAFEYASARPNFKPAIEGLRPREALRGPPDRSAFVANATMSARRVETLLSSASTHQAYVESDPDSDETSRTLHTSRPSSESDPDDAYSVTSIDIDETVVPHTLYAPPSLINVRRPSLSTPDRPQDIDTDPEAPESPIFNDQRYPEQREPSFGAQNDSFQGDATDSLAGIQALEPTHIPVSSPRPTDKPSWPTSSLEDEVQAIQPTRQLSPVRGQISREHEIDISECLVNTDAQTKTNDIITLDVNLPLPVSSFEDEVQGIRPTRDASPVRGQASQGRENDISQYLVDTDSHSNKLDDSFTVDTKSPPATAHQAIDDTGPLTTAQETPRDQGSTPSQPAKGERKKRTGASIENIGSQPSLGPYATRTSLHIDGMQSLRTELPTRSKTSRTRLEKEDVVHSSNTELATSPASPRTRIDKENVVQSSLTELPSRPKTARTKRDDENTLQSSRSELLTSPRMSRRRLDNETVTRSSRTERPPGSSKAVTTTTKGELPDAEGEEPHRRRRRRRRHPRSSANRSSTAQEGSEDVSSTAPRKSTNVSSSQKADPDKISSTAPRKSSSPTRKRRSTKPASPSLFRSVLNSLMGPSSNTGSSNSNSSRSKKSRRDPYD